MTDFHKIRDQIVGLSNRVQRGDIKTSELGALLVPVIKLAIILCPVNKMHDFVYCSEHGLNINMDCHGADAIDEKKQTVELKISRLKKTEGRCNFNWDIPSQSYKDRTKLLMSIGEKTSGGARLVVQDELGRDLFEYVLSGAFLVGYFAHLTITDKTKNHNMSCKRCPSCGRFHHMDMLVDMSKTFDKNPEQFVWSKEVYSNKYFNCQDG